MNSSLHPFLPKLKRFSLFQKSTKKSGSQLLSKVVYASFTLLFLVGMNSLLLAQNVLVGLTSSAGPSGGGTAFSIKTTGSNFTVHQSFANVGAYPYGDLIKGFDGNFYGMTNSGDNSYGTIFKMTPAGVINVLKKMDASITGAFPYGSLLQGKDSAFYGMTNTGGSSGYGTIFRITATGTFKVLKNLSLTTTGGSPYGNLVQGADGALYGMTSEGGTYGDGTVFKITTTGTFTLLKHLSANTTGGRPHGALFQGNDGNFYGMTSEGGTYGSGTIFKITPTGTLTVLKHLDYNVLGAYPYGSLIKTSDGTFYGMTNSGGKEGYGTIFKITSGGTFTILKNLDGTTTGANPEGSLVQGADGAFYGMTNNGGSNNEGTIFKITSTGTFTVLRHLSGTTDGSRPHGSLYKDSDGIFYGMTFQGGSSTTNSGTIFKISSSGSFTVLNRLPDNAKGIAPQESLVQASDGYFYGTTAEGGAYGYGAIYKLCTNGSFTVLRSLTQITGSNPKGSLLQAKDGNFYGTTYYGGSNNMGTIFKMTTSGTLTVLKNLSATTGGFPEGSLLQGADSALYGMTRNGGTKNSGTIFKITTAGTITILKNLDAATTGGYPRGNLVQDSSGYFYGMITEGGTDGGGTIFKITPTGTFTVLKHLSNSTGAAPYGSLIKGTDGAFYGLTSKGGSAGYGTIFKITSTGTLTVLKNLDGTTTGSSPQGSLVQDSDGALYGMTTEGGTYKGGTIFKITTTGTFTVLRHLNPATDGSMPYGSLVIQKTTPVVNAQSVTTNEDVAKAITFSATGGTATSYTISTAPKNGTLSGSGATRTYTPKANFYGRDSFYVAANWGCQTSAAVKISITVNSVNDAPVLATIGNKTVAKGTTLTFTATATDVDAGQTKTFSLVTPPTGATINATSGVFSWTPATAGTYTFKVRVTDNGSPVLYDEEQITVTVATTTLTTTTLTNSASNKYAENSEIIKTTLYPNPVTSDIKVMLGEAADEVELRILDMKGALMLVKKYSGLNKQLEVDASRLKSGSYLLQLQTKKGSSEVLKFIKL